MTKKYNMEIHGILHIGAHTCEELFRQLICSLTNATVNMERRESLARIGLTSTEEL